jgi:hypothetical protein
MARWRSHFPDLALRGVPQQLLSRVVDFLSFSAIPVPEVAELSKVFWVSIELAEGLGGRQGTAKKCQSCGTFPRAL